MYLLDTAMLDNMCEIIEEAAKGIIRLLSQPRLHGKEGRKKEWLEASNKRERHDIERKESRHQASIMGRRVERL